MVVGRRAAGLHHCNDSQETLTSRRAVTGRFSAFHVQVFSSGDGGRPGQSDRCERSSGDSRGVEEGGGDDLRAVGQVRNPLLVLAADSTSGDEEIRPQQVLEGGQNSGDLDRPLLVAPVLLLLHRRRRSMLGFLAVDLEVAELGVGQQNSVVQHGRSDSGAEGQQDHDAGGVLARSERVLGDSGSVGVVEDGDLAPAQRLAEQGGGVGVDPGLVDVRGAARDAPGHDSGQGDADRTGPLGLLDDLGDSARDRIGCGRLRGQDLDAVTDHFPCAQVDRAALDAAAADVDPETCGCHRPALLSVEFEVTIYRCKH